MKIFVCQMFFQKKTPVKGPKTSRNFTVIFQKIPDCELFLVKVSVIKSLSQKNPIVNCFSRKNSVNSWESNVFPCKSTIVNCFYSKSRNSQRFFQEKSRKFTEIKCLPWKSSIVNWFSRKSPVNLEINNRFSINNRFCQKTKESPEHLFSKPWHALIQIYQMPKTLSSSNRTFVIIRKILSFIKEIGLNALLKNSVILLFLLKIGNS